MLAVCWDSSCTHVMNAAADEQVYAGRAVPNKWQDLLGVRKMMLNVKSRCKTHLWPFSSSYFPASLLKQKKCVQPLLFNSLPPYTLFFSPFPVSFVPSPPLCVFQWLTCSPSPYVSYVFTPSPPTSPIPLSPSHSPTYAHFLHKASNTLQVTFKKIDLFLHSLHPSKTYSIPLPSSPHFLLRCVYLLTISSLHWSSFSHWNSRENWTGLWFGTGWQ